MKDGPAISISGLSKRFALRRGSRVLLDLVLRRKGAPPRGIEALEGVSLSVSHGEVVGVIGKNGSGKSTLLKIVAGLYRKKAGSVRISGRILYLSGFQYITNPYLSVRENIELICTVFGLRRRQIRAKTGAIADFAGLTGFLDVETSKLSSGMVSRLNVSATFHSMEHADPQVLLLDETLSAGGDLEFQEKSARWIDGFVHRGAAVLMVSHNLAQIERLCERVIWIEGGRIRADGPAKTVVAAYEQACGGDKK